MSGGGFRREDVGALVAISGVLVLLAVPGFHLGDWISGVIVGLGVGVMIGGLR